MCKKFKKGFTLVELMLVVAILSMVIVSMAKLFIYTSVLAEMTSNVSIAVSEVQSKIEEIRNTDFVNIAANYSDGGTPGSTFDLGDLTGKGYISIDSTSNTELLLIEVSACWRNKYGRVVGEDQNLDGFLDPGTEDIDGDGKVDSTVSIMSMITRR